MTGFHTVDHILTSNRGCCDSHAENLRLPPPLHALTETGCNRAFTKIFIKRASQDDVALAVVSFECNSTNAISEGIHKADEIEGQTGKRFRWKDTKVFVHATDLRVDLRKLTRRWIESLCPESFESRFGPEFFSKTTRGFELLEAFHAFST